MPGRLQPGAQTPLIIGTLAPLYDRLQPIAYAALRAGFGVTMVTHGLPKLLGASHGSMADPMAASTALIADVLHLPGAPTLALLVAVLESFGGAMLAVGLLTRLIAPMFAVQMAVICLALGPTWPWIDRGIEYPFVLGLIAFLIAIRGGGDLSIDRLIGREF
jgi:putative oxidoreductase